MKIRDLSQKQAAPGGPRRAPLILFCSRIFSDFHAASGAAVVHPILGSEAGKALAAMDYRRIMTPSSSDFPRTVVPAALITELNSEQSGRAIGQVMANV